jgi:hypothetical protein
LVLAWKKLCPPSTKKKKKKDSTKLEDGVVKGGAGGEDRVARMRILTAG